MFDEIFGELEYKYNLFKYENISIFDKEYEIKIVVETYDKTILDIQKQNYKNYLEYIKTNKEEIISEIKKYFLDVYGQNIDIRNDIVPTTVYFSKDGSWGILFDTPIDEENGFAFFVKNNDLSVGTQDMFI